MKKNIITILLFSIFFFCIPFRIYASYDAVITGNTVRIRNGAGTNNDAIFTLNSNTSISVIDKTLYTGEGCDKKWYKISYNDKIGYVCSIYVKFIDASFDNINVVDYSARVSGNNVSIRQSATTSSKSIDSLSLGVNVEILEQVNKNNSGCSSNTWYKIRYYGDVTGYICSTYVDKKQDITASDSEYEKVLREAGFPDSYLPYLVYLHSKYPNWNFVAKNTNLDFSASVSSEAGKNYMQTTNDNYRTSKVMAEKGGWYKVNEQVIAFYMDPRNWLTDKRIFAFEKLDYDDSLVEKYPSLVKAIFQGGKLSDDIYTNAMVNAGSKNRISPVHIASRIRLEVGPNGSDSTNGCEFTFKGQKYSGFYNFFNIGAYEETIDGVKYSSITRGLAYAAQLINRDGELWNNIETSITEGSSFLANGYVNKGQGTLYYQKFNVSPDAYYNTYTHQYQTNIQAPAIEGNTAFNSYVKANVVNNNYIFEIPVYNNMPAYSSLPNSGDTNNDLANLSVEGFDITPAFDSDVLTYDVYIPKATTKINIIAASSSSLATVSGNGEIELLTDESDLTITVKAQSGEIKKYTLSVHKVDDTTTCDQAIGNASLSVNGNYATKLKNNTTVATLRTALFKSGAKNVTITDAKNNSVNDNTIIGTGFKLQIETSIESKTYTLSVKGDTSGDGKITILDLLQVQKHIKGVGILSGEYLMAGDTSGDGKVTILDLLQIQKHIKGAQSL